MIALAFALAQAAPWPPPVAVVNSPPPPVVAVPGPPYPKAAPMPPPGAPRLVRPPLPRAPLRQLVTAEDFPASALARREEGRVGFLLEVGANGRALHCTVNRPSGSRALDAATCTIMMRRARFTPAVDSNGMQRAGRVEDWVLWTLPAASGPERG